ncbi:tellurite resistance TerB family protein [bacterium]|nr:tellurite resistance TerB family protein [bacterium]
MLQGLHLMGEAELSELVKLTHAKLSDNLEEDQKRRHILTWAGKVVGCSSHDPVEIERECLLWLAGHWAVETKGLEDTDELERALRIRIADEASDYLAPVWWISCALIAAGPADAINPKVRLLDKAASLVVPSRSARHKLSENWRIKASEWGFNSLNQPEIQQAVEQLKKTPEKADQALTLALVISLADGRLSFEEDRLVKELGAACGLAPEICSEKIRHVNSIYWGHQVEVTPKRQIETAEQDKRVAMQAAQMTLESAGTLEGLCLEACDKVVGRAEGAEEHAPKSGWQRVLGTVSGLKQFFGNKMRGDEQVNLVRLVYLAIIHQHAQAAAAAEAAAAAQRRANAPEPVAHAPAPSTKDPVKAIKLD